MEPNHLAFGGGAADTVMHPLVALVMVVSIAIILVRPRQYLIAPFFICAFLIPGSQMLVVGGIHLFVLRVVLLFGCLRMLFAKVILGTQVLGVKLNALDHIFIAWATCRHLAFLILFSFQSAALINQVGSVIDVFGGYFFLRFLIHDKQDILRVIKLLAIITAIVGACMINEKLRNQNVFGYLGGLSVLPQVRDGAIRAQGPFAHPILAGCFGATLLPLFWWLWKGGKAKTHAIVGAFGSTSIVLTCASSTPLMAYVFGIVGLCFWPARRYMRQFRWGLAIALLCLHLAMKAPVWFLIARVDLTGASSGYHRAMLVDTFIRHFWDWWLVGTDSNTKWGYDMWDVSNQFVAEGITGGLATFTCFIAMISMSFGRIGRARKVVKDRKEEWLLWSLGATLVSNIAAFFGISYFDHTQIAWFALLIMINVLTSTVLMSKRTKDDNVSILKPTPEMVPTALE